MSVRKIDSYFGPQTNSFNQEELQKKQKTSNTVTEITNLIQSWDVQSDLDINTSSCDESSTDSEHANCNLVKTAHKEDQVSVQSLLPQSGPCDITQVVSDNPTQLVLKNYPRNKFGKEWRNFHSEWFKLYPWLEYSVLENSCYSFPCRFFSSDPSGSPFSESGFKNWKKAMEKNSDIGTSCIMVESLIDYLKEFRTVDRLFNEFLEKVVLFAENNNILLPEENLMCRRTHRKLPVRFSSYITELPTFKNRTVMCKNDVKIIIFNPVIDRMINELQQRFSDNNPILS
ncbi:hypothetical protein QTP88_014917 [Uroleucon formosanum]